MSEHPKKHQQKKGKHVPKEQPPRKPQQPKKDQTKDEDKKPPTKESKMRPAQDPSQVVPINLSGEVLNITEAPDAKYKKKEIQNNWAKYEMPLDSYEDTEEYDVGIDYEKLLQAPPSAGGHFQFKHERSWEQDDVPSLYDKYFDVTARDLTPALNTIPFYKRNDLELSMFDESEIREMDSKAERCKLKYYNKEPEVTDRLIDIIKSKDNCSLGGNEVAGCLPNSEGNEDCRLVKDIGISKSMSSPECELINEVTKDIAKLTHEDVKLKNRDIEATSADKKTIVDSPEDLEKWLDDFLDS